MKTKLNVFLILTLFLLFASNKTWAQQLYLNYSLGNNSPMAKGFTVVDNKTTNVSPNYIYEYKNLNGGGSYGTGIQTMIALGYKFGEHVLAELGFEYLLGSKFTSTNSNIYKSGSYTSQLVSSLTTSAKLFRINPSVCMTVGNNTFKPYMAMGIVMGVFPKIKDSYTETNSATGRSDMVTHGESAYSGGLPIGFSGKLGMEFSVSNKISLFMEYHAIAQSWAPKKRKITKYEINNTDKLSTLTTSQKETEYSNNYNYTTNYSSANAPLSSSPSKDLKFYFPLSSMGLNFGIKIKLGKTIPPNE